MLTAHWRLRRPFLGRVIIECLVVPYNVLSGLLGEFGAVWRFLCLPTERMSFSQRLRFVYQSCRVTAHVPSPHTQAEILAFVSTVLSVPPEVKGCIVEAGAYRGGSTAKFSIAAKFACRRLVVFDSFEGLPDHQEPHDKSIHGEPTDFRKGAYRGPLPAVQAVIRRFGYIEECRFIKGWFSETMPNFREPIVAAYIDVDLAASTRDCLKYLYPLLQPGCFLFSQDGHLPLVIDVLRDDTFWRNDVGFPRPDFQGLGHRKLVFAQKPYSAHASSHLGQEGRVESSDTGQSNAPAG